MTKKNKKVLQINKLNSNQFSIVDDDKINENLEIKPVDSPIKKTMQPFNNQPSFALNNKEINN